MYLIDIPFNGCQGRSNRSSIVHAVSYFACSVNDTACIFIFFAYHRCFAYDFHFFCACGVNETASTMHVVSITLHAPCMRCQWYRMHRASGINDTACILKNLISSRIRIYIRKGFSPLIRSPGRMFWWKNRGSKIWWHCPFNNLDGHISTFKLFLLFFY
jgi:hypothetical protein